MQRVIGFGDVGVEVGAPGCGVGREGVFVANSMIVETVYTETVAVYIIVIGRIWIVSCYTVALTEQRDSRAISRVAVLAGAGY